MIIDTIKAKIIAGKLRNIAYSLTSPENRVVIQKKNEQAIDVACTLVARLAYKLSEGVERNPAPAVELTHAVESIVENVKVIAKNKDVFKGVFSEIATEFKQASASVARRTKEFKLDTDSIGSNAMDIIKEISGISTQ